MSHEDFCNKCKHYQVDTFAWMDHLVSYHPIPRTWMSEQAAFLVGEEALRPYTTISKSKKKRKPGTIPRPLNSFMIFAQYVRRRTLPLFADASNSEISKRLGLLWRSVPEYYKKMYNAEASRLVKVHSREYPDYKYQPKKKVLKPIGTSERSPTMTSERMPMMRQEYSEYPLNVKVEADYNTSYQRGTPMHHGSGLAMYLSPPMSSPATSFHMFNENAMLQSGVSNMQTTMDQPSPVFVPFNSELPVLSNAPFEGHDYFGDIAGNDECSTYSALVATVFPNVEAMELKEEEFSLSPMTDDVILADDIIMNQQLDDGSLQLPYEGFLMTTSG